MQADKEFGTGLLVVFELEIKHQSNLALRAATEMELALALNATDRFWFALHALVTSAANVSKLLWERTGAADRRALRSALEIDDDSPIRNRVLRNHLEHFDERLAKWSAEGRVGLVDIQIVSTRSELGEGSAREVMRVFETETWEATFYDERFEIRPLVAELERLHHRVDDDLRRRVRGYGP